MEGRDTQEKKISKIKEKRQKMMEKQGKKLQNWGNLDKTLIDPVSIKVKIYPNKEQREMLKQYIGCARVARNNALYLLNNTNKSHSEIKKEVVVNDKREWFQKCPYIIRNNAVEQLWKDITAMKKKQEKDGKPFKMHYIKKDKMKSEIIQIESKYINFQQQKFTNSNRVQLLGNNYIRYKDSKSVCDFLKKLVRKGSCPCKNEGDKKGLRYNKDCIIQYERGNKQFYILVPYQKGEFMLPSEKRREENKLITISVPKKLALPGSYKGTPPNFQGALRNKHISSLTPGTQVIMNNEINKELIMGMDPGIREPINFYSYDKSGTLDTNFYKIVKPFYEKIIKNAKIIVNKESHKYRRKNRKGEIKEGIISVENWGRKKREEICRLYSKLRRIRHHHHYTTINWIYDNYEFAILPKFQTQNMIKRDTRVLSKASVKDLLSFCPYEFRTRFKYKGGKRAIIASEEYTTMTCGICGTLNSIGSSKVYECKNCGLICDRDINGARNILIKILCVLLILKNKKEHNNKCK